MRSLPTRRAFGIFLCSLSVGLCQEQDLRDRFGTRSIDAARQIARAIQLSESNKHKEALEAIEAAIKADDRSQMAYLWKANILASLGEVPDSIEAYKKCLAGDLARSRAIGAMAASKLGVVLGKLNELDESNVYFTEAILADYDNESKIRASAYRNLAANAERRGQSLASALALTFAFRDKAKDVTEQQINSLFEKGQEQEVARILYFPEKTPKLDPRPQDAKLSTVAVGGEISESISNLWPDPRGRYLIALSPNSRHYHLISTSEKVTIRKVQVEGQISSACLVGERLYAGFNNPPRIDAIVPETGAVASTYPLKGRPPASLAVFPPLSRAFFPAEGVIHDVDLKTGSVAKTTIPADVVAGHPTSPFVFSYVKNARSRWLPCTLVKSVVTPGGLLIAEIRENASANGTSMSVSPDGHWVAIAGGGGWRPNSNPADGGYGVPVFGAMNLEHWQGFFATDAYPRGVSFNPTTGQVAAIREQDATIYHLADAKSSAKVKGPFNGVSAWSGDGRYLIMGGAEKGVLCWANALNDEETRLAGTWWKSLKIPEPRVNLAPRPAFQAISSLRDFKYGSPSREDLARAIAKAMAEGNVAKPPSWRDFEPYLKDDEMRRVVQGIEKSLLTKEDFGITIYQVKTALKASPDGAPLRYFLAEALSQGNRFDEAQGSYLDAVHSDAGRTELSCMALDQLALLLDSQGQDFPAIQCLAASLSLDRADPRALEMAERLLKKHDFAREAEALRKLMADRLPTPAGRTADLPRLAKPPDSKKPGAAELYRTAVRSVVLVKVGDGSGSGVCIGSADSILTNHHVVAGSEVVEVYPFAYQGGALVRLPRLKARVVFESPSDDLAVLRLDEASKDLVPLPVAERSPEVGERVYSIGSPGLGGGVLEQSISEGIVSASNRVIDGSKYLQHTAAINPGNSGGPLIDEWGRLAAVVTLKAKLESVGFAVPVETVRAVFKSP